MESVNKFISLIVLVIGLVVIWRRPGNDEEVLRLESVISSLLKYEQNHVDRTSPKIAVGFGACKDLFVTRSHMMQGVGFPQTVDNYLGVGSQEEMISMLGYFFQAGAAGQSDLSAKWGLGARFVKEGAAVLLAVKLNPGLAEWISDGMEVAGGEVGEDDVHLVVEYKSQEVWDGVASPRANRFIVHHNLNNPLVSRLE